MLGKQLEIRTVNRVKGVNWCREKQNWAVCKVIFSDEMSVIVG